MTITKATRDLLLGALRATPSAQLTEALDLLIAEFAPTPEVTEVTAPQQLWGATVAF